MVSEQDTVKEVQAQTDFAESNPEAQALDPRHRDAETHLSERMGHNHRLNRAADTHADNVDGLDKSSSADNKWQDGLRRDENDKV